MNTPEAKRKAKGKETGPKTPGPCPYKGKRIIVPGDIFDEPGTDFKAVIKGWNGKKTDSVTAKFDDGTQYWFPLADVLTWLQDGDAAPDTPITAAGGSSGGAAADTPVRSGQAADGLRNRRTRAAQQQAAASIKQADADDSEAATADEVFDMPLWQQQSDQQQLQQQQGPLQESSSSSGLGGLPAAGVVAGVVLLLVVMLLAILASKGPAHDLEDFMDNLVSLTDGIKDKLRGRQAGQ